MKKILQGIINLFAEEKAEPAQKLIAVAKDGTTLFEKSEKDILWNRILQSYKDNQPFRKVSLRKSGKRSGSAVITDYTNNTVRTIDWVLPFKHETHVFTFDNVSSPNRKQTSHTMTRIIPPSGNFKGEILTYNMGI